MKITKVLKGEEAGGYLDKDFALLYHTGGKPLLSFKEMLKDCNILFTVKELNSFINEHKNKSMIERIELIASFL